MHDILQIVMEERFQRPALAPLVVAPQDDRTPAIELGDKARSLKTHQLFNFFSDRLCNRAVGEGIAQVDMGLVERNAEFGAQKGQVKLLAVIRHQEGETRQCPSQTVPGFWPCT